MKDAELVKTGFDQSLAAYHGDASPDNAKSLAVSAQSYAGALALLADAVDYEASTQQEASSDVIRCRRAVVRAQDAIAQANPVQIPGALQSNADTAISRLQEAQERLTKINTISAYPITGR
jgi:hypothetical protein